MVFTMLPTPFTSQAFSEIGCNQTPRGFLLKAIAKYTIIPRNGGFQTAEKQNGAWEGAPA